MAGTLHGNIVETLRATMWRRCAQRLYNFFTLGYENFLLYRILVIFVIGQHFINK